MQQNITIVYITALTYERDTFDTKSIFHENILQNNQYLEDVCVSINHIFHFMQFAKIVILHLRSDPNMMRDR